METIDRTQTRERYERELREQIVPFWLEHGVDREHGGLYAGLDRRGAIIDTDKSVWFQGRLTWLLASIYADLERNPEWLELARSGIASALDGCHEPVP